MSQIQRIVVATDFSECSFKALEQASVLAKGFGATVDVLHVYTAPAFIAPEAMVGYAAGESRTLSELLRHEAEEGLAKFVDRARTRGLPLAQAHIEYGEPSTRIVEFAREQNYDLIAVGTHGRTGLSHFLLGSVAERVVRRADRPVLTARTEGAGDSQA